MSASSVARPTSRLLASASSSLVGPSPIAGPSTWWLHPRPALIDIDYRSSSIRNTRHILPAHKQCRCLHTTPRRSSTWPADAEAQNEAEERERDAARRLSASRNVSAEAPSAMPSSPSRAGPTLQDRPESTPVQPSAAPQPQPPVPAPPRQKTIMYMDKLKAAGTPIVMLTAHDYPSALSLRSADVDICLVGDSLANVALGHDTTQSLTLDAMAHHCQAVHRGLSSPLLSLTPPSLPDTPNVARAPFARPLFIADMPFGSFSTSVQDGMRNVTDLMHRTGVDGVKIEGGREVTDLMRRLTSFGIPVMGHIGLQPQRVGATSGYRVQGRTAEAAQRLLDDALELQDAGAFAFVLECVPAKVGRVLASRLRIPIIGIGAGPHVDGQVLVYSDMVGELTSPGHVIAGLVSHPDGGGSGGGGGDDLSPAVSHVPVTPSPHAPSPPKFVRSFVGDTRTSIGALRLHAVRAYVDAVRSRSFPNEGESYKMQREEWEAWAGKLGVLEA